MCIRLIRQVICRLVSVSERINDACFRYCYSRSTCCTLYSGNLHKSNNYYRRRIKDKELRLFKDINFIWSLSKEPTTNIQSDWNVEDDESDEDYKKPLRAPGNRENVFGEILGTRLV